MSRSRSFLAGLALTVVACRPAPSEPAPVAATSTGAAPAPRATTAAAPSERTTFPHDVTSFTEGLLYADGALYESTGMYGESKLRKVDLASGQVLAQVRLTREYFGEGLALLNGELVQLTYREGRAFVYDASTLEKKRELSYTGEGWGLTTDGERFVMSDGTPVITFRDAATFTPLRTLRVVGEGGPVSNLNELEWVDGFLLANVWMTNTVVRIDPKSGRVVGTIDLGYLPEPQRGKDEDNVLNGIAYDRAGGRLFVTGKRWSHVFLIPKPW